MPYTRYRCAHCPETFPLTVEGAKAAVEHERQTRHTVQASPWAVEPVPDPKVSSISDGSTITPN